ncbi:hypothetical protein SynMINOS11_00571 [Synechococcus sp. Minos11]|nr:hypothetical protein SynMINOS11_00571 [Synechococcus sp. Minos11]
MIGPGDYPAVHRLVDQSIWNGWFRWIDKVQWRMAGSDGLE